MKLKWKDDGTIKSPLARAKGLGSAHEGVEHWWHQRVTAISNFALMIWLVWSVISLNGLDYETFTAWLAQPVNAILMILSVISVFYHAYLGSQVIVEDYFHNDVLRIMKLLGIKLFFFAACVACIFSIVKVALGV